MQISHGLAASLALAALAVPAVAQEGQEGGRGGGRQRIVAPLMQALDADQDGALSPAEIENAAKALAKLDKNGDGTLSTDELHQPRVAPAELAVDHQVSRVLRDDQVRQVVER